MFKVSEILKATKGRLIRGNADSIVGAISTDSRTIRAKEAFLAIKGDNFDGHKFIPAAISKNAGCVILEKGRRLDYAAKIPFIAVKDTVRALALLAHYQREKFNLPVVAVTGSNGKTTTKDMIAELLSHKFRVLKNSGTKNNRIGVPQTLLGLNSAHEIAVIELGSNHPGEINYLTNIARPNIGVITNIAHSHLEFFKDIKGIFEEKISLIRKLQPPKTALVNGDDRSLRKIALSKSRKHPTFSFSLERKSDFAASGIRRLKGKIEFTVNKKYKFTLKTLGYYNVYNALAAVAVARIFGLGYPDIIRALKGFNFPQGRLNTKEIKGVNFIDDTYNANPLSLKCALGVLGDFPAKGRKIFIMGDMLELGARTDLFHRAAGRLAATACDVFITVGKHSRSAASQAQKHGLKRSRIFSCDSAIDARGILFNIIYPLKEDIVLIKGSRGMKMEEILRI